MRKSVEWLLIWIAQCGNHSHIQALINANMTPILVNILKDGELSEKTDIAWTIYFLAKKGSPYQTSRLLECNVLETMCELLTTQNNNFLNVVKTTLTILLMV